jgi:hypothetical protein
MSTCAWNARNGNSIFTECPCRFAIHSLVCAILGVFYNTAIMKNMGEEGKCHLKK